MKRLVVIFLLVFGQSAYADIYDRIQNCEERDGANGCIYDLLRELASTAPAPQAVTVRVTYTSPMKIKLLDLEGVEHEESLTLGSGLWGHHPEVPLDKDFQVIGVRVLSFCADGDGYQLHRFSLSKTGINKLGVKDFGNYLANCLVEKNEINSWLK